MTAIRARQESRYILDFSNGKYSKNKIKKALGMTKVINYYEGKNENDLIFRENKIMIGMYTVLLELSFDSSPNWEKLKEYGDFEVSVYETTGTEVKRIDLKKDSRFKNQYWVSNNFFGKLRITHLVDIIAHCQRLDKLKAFL